MKIAHFAPFAPLRAGIYEAARDMVRADLIAGHSVAFVDSGVHTVNGREPRKIGAIDIRGNFKLETVDFVQVKDYDLFIVHDGSQTFAEFFAQTKIPIIKPLHVRPAACFATEKQNPVYQFYQQEARNPKIKAWFTMWDEFLPYWEIIIPREKLFSTGSPPIDQYRFSKEGAKHEFGKKGEFNIVIADSWREDISPFHALHGLIQAAKHLDLRVHVYGAPTDNRTLDIILLEMRRRDILGECFSQVDYLPEVYRACNLLVTPHIIATRIMAEAICCGAPVLAATGCRYTPYTCQPNDPFAIAEAVQNIIAKDSPALGDPRPFSLEIYAEKMTAIYDKVLSE